MSDVQKLIAEARGKANDPNDYPPAILLTELCDALEDASRAASRIWADGARAALLSEGYAVADNAAVLLQNPHGVITPVELGPGDREALVEVLDTTGLRCGRDNCGGGQDDCCFCEDTIASYVEATLAAGFSRPTESASSSGGPADTILAACGQYFESNGLATEWTRASRPEYTTARPRATWSVVGRPPVDMLSVLARLAEDTLSRPVGGETVTEWEYGTGHTSEPGIGAAESSLRAAKTRVADWNRSTRTRTGVVVRRRKAGPWLPVSPEQDGGKR